MLVTAFKEVQNLLGGETFPKIESPSLRLEKFVRLGENTKKDEIARVVACHAKHRRQLPPFTPAGAVTFTAALGGRLIVNQAGGILENAGLCLHRHFGDPHIPGSAVKGLARHAAWLAWNVAEGEEKTEIERKMGLVFGDTARGGGVAFLAAVPEGAAALAMDLVNCHHPKYYAGKKEDATDDESPNPQFFPVVETGATFRFTLVPLRRLGPERAALLVQAKAWLIEALTVSGAGAKTAAGYGWFSYDAAKAEREEKEERDRQQRLADDACRKVEEQARLATLGPIERATDHLLKLPQEPFAHFAKNLSAKSEDEQRAFVRLMRHSEKKDWWKKKKKLDVPLADAIREIAAQLKEELS